MCNSELESCYLNTSFKKAYKGFGWAMGVQSRLFKVYILHKIYRMLPAKFGVPNSYNSQDQ